LTSESGELVHTSSVHGKQGWSELDVIGDGAACGSAAAFTPKPLARAEIFSPSPEGGPTQRSHQSPDPGGAWSDLEAFGGEGLTRLSTLVWPDGHVEVFALGADATIHHKASQPGTDEWSEWASLGGEDLITGVSPILWGDGHAELFATDAAGVVWHSGSGDFPGGWAPWEALEGAVASRPIPVRWPDGHLSVFARGVSGELVHSEHDGSWKPLSVLGEGTRIAGDPSAIMNPGSFGSAGPEIVARDEHGQVLHMWWLGEAYGAWSAHFDQRVASDPFLWVRADGHAEVLGVDGEGRLVSSWHAATGWTAWEVVASEGLNPCRGDGGGESTGGAGSSSGGDSDDGGLLPDDPKSDDAAAMDGGCSCRVTSTTPGAPLGVLALVSMLVAAGVRRRWRARASSARARDGAQVATLLAGAAVLLGCAGSDPVGETDGFSDGGAGGDALGGGGDTGSGASDAAGGSDVGATGGAGTAGDCPAGLTCVAALPFDDQRDTSLEGSQLFDAYACKATADESGPEIVYRVDVPQDGTLTATVTDGDGVDIDVHVLTDLDVASCVARDDVTATAAVTAGVVYVVADTYVSSGVAQSGAYEIAIALAP
jgi:MYXO-CTERM domain-containing protein